MTDKEFDLPVVGKIKIINFPRTMTVLALGFLAGNLLFVPAIAVMGQYVPDKFVPSVEAITGLFKDGMLLILGSYFRDQIRRSENPDAG